MIRKLVATLAAAAVIATSTIAASAPAEAYYRHWHHGPGVGPAIVGGLIGGLALGAIVNSQRHYYDDEYYDGPYYSCRRVLYENQYGERYWRRVCD